MNQDLKKLLNNSYSPYSNFKVAAILVTNDGKIFNGVNVENAAYATTICAEKAAIVSAISQGYKPFDFNEIHLTASTDKFISPCGSCRQVLTEMLRENKKVIIYFDKDKTKILTVKELLPFSFSKEDLL